MLSTKYQLESLNVLDASVTDNQIAFLCMTGSGSLPLNAFKFNLILKDLFKVKKQAIVPGFKV